MWKPYLAATILISICFFSCKSSKHTVKRLPGMWQVTPIVVDGKNTDWPSPYPNYDDKALIGYAYSNDKDKLYITVETGDLATQLKILKEGLTVWIDRKGGNEEVTAINYPIPQRGENNIKSSEASEPGRPVGGTMQQGQSNRQDKMRIALEDRIKYTMDHAKDYSLQGFKSCNLQYSLLEKDTCGIEIKMSIDADNEFVWEAAIPFKTFYFKNEITKVDKGRPISICIETTGAGKPKGEGSGAGNRPVGGAMRPGIGFGVGPMGMGMHTGGGMRGSRSRPDQPGNNMMEPLYKSTTTWKTFGIAYP
jgi:hypothetical protein